jgi:plasmid stabilization system protein ParE
MRVRWTASAADDLTAIVGRIYAKTPQPHNALHARFTLVLRVCANSPIAGGSDWAPNTRELVFVPWPYIAVYEVIQETVQVLRFRHASQDWP